MTPEEIRRLYRRESAATDAEATQTLQDVATNPETARQMFQAICALAVEDHSFQTVLRAVLDSVLLDIVTNSMQANDEFALVVGRRLAHMMDAVKPAVRAGRYRTSKSA